MQSGVEPLVAGGVEEGAQLGGVPDTGRTCAGWASPGVGVMSDVSYNQLALDGLVERGPDDHVDLEDRLGCQSSAVTPARSGQALIQSRWSARILLKGI